MPFGSPELAKNALEEERKALQNVKAQRAAATTPEQAAALDQWVAVQEQRLAETVAHAKIDLEIAKDAAPELRQAAQAGRKVSPGRAKLAAAREAYKASKTPQVMQAVAQQPEFKPSGYSITTQEFVPQAMADKVIEVTTGVKGDVLPVSVPVTTPEATPTVAPVATVATTSHYVPPAGQASNWEYKPAAAPAPATPATPTSPVEVEAEKVVEELTQVTANPFPWKWVGAAAVAGVVLYWGYSRSRRNF